MGLVKGRRPRAVGVLASSLNASRREIKNEFLVTCVAEILESHTFLHWFLSPELSRDLWCKDHPVLHCQNVDMKLRGILSGRVTRLGVDTKLLKQKQRYAIIVVRTT